MKGSSRHQREALSQSRFRVEPDSQTNMHGVRIFGRTSNSEVLVRDRSLELDVSLETGISSEAIGNV
jgi:hypothetical protein